MASKLADNFKPEEAYQFAKKHTDKSWFKDFRLLYKMITDPSFALKPFTWALIAGALAYVIMPIDVIPDFIPGLGWLDDIFVLSATMAKLSEEISRYNIHTQA
jgi:uncharacterized membrane protein YkvA (DUF1232 family)